MKWSGLTPHRAVAYTCAFSLVLLLPFLGLADFNTKGEPREAMVAAAMLQQGDWILPVTFGSEIPYKPPFMHWCVAAASILTGGHVTEYTSRLPSALALTAMLMAVCGFFTSRKRPWPGLLTSALTLTCFEIYRGAMACRVDMMLTALSVCAILELYRWWERGMKNLPAAAILLMSAATLTKGPVGIIIPCLSAGIFMLLRGVPFFKAFIWLTLWGVLSLILPLCWYAMAYARGGTEFMDLVMEENFGRMSGTMSYESHANPWIYNVLTLLAGFLPWTLIALASLFVAKWCKAKPLAALHRSLHRLRAMEPKRMLAVVAALTVFIFYCIPTSKRSVYLMPMYPFTAMFLAELFLWLQSQRPGLLRGFSRAFAAIACAAFVAFAVMHWTIDPSKLRPSLSSAMITGLATAGGWRPWFWALISLSGAVLVWALPNTAKRLKPALTCVATVAALWLGLAGCYQPALLNAKSLRSYAALIDRSIGEGGLYEYIPAAEMAKGNPLHFFELNFYLGDRIRNFQKSQPKQGYLLVERNDAAAAIEKFEAQGYSFRKILSPGPQRGKHTPLLYRFEKN